MNNEMKALADSLWTYMLPKIKEHFGSCVHFYRAQVVSPADNGKITVQRPFDTTQLQLPYVAAMANAVAGEQVTVFVFGTDANNINNSVIVNNGTFSL